jgi:hypothetical protein
MTRTQDLGTTPPCATALAQSADAVFVGKLRALGPEPSFLSGERRAEQWLELEVETAAKGPLAAGLVVKVDVAVVGGAPHVARGQRGLPALDPGVLRAGRRLRVHAVREGERWCALAGEGAITPLG